MQTLIWNNLTTEEKTRALSRPAHTDDTILLQSTADIIRNVKQRGDTAVREYNARFDKNESADLRVPPQEIAAAIDAITPELRAALTQAKTNIEKFHAAEHPHNISVETMSGVTCELHWRAIDTVGLYVPGGTAPLFSSVLMQAIPAQIAQCPRIILCTPPQKDGNIHPAVLAAAYLCGITEIFACGGAQAIAAMAYGTETIPKADKIFGPGNAYVTAAKQWVSQDPTGAAIDMPAGPSEVMVIADASCRAAPRPDWVAADMLAQAEHGADSQSVLVTTDAAFAEKTNTEIQKQLAQLSRQSIAAQSIGKSRIIITPDMDTALDVANQYAPEHLIIHNDNAARYLPRIRNAGSVFLGAWTPESAGDYASGINHVLPTYGYARAYNGLNVLSFMKSMSVQSLTKSGLQNLGTTIITMAEGEGLDAHANAVKIRLGE